MLKGAHQRSPTLKNNPKFTKNQVRRAVRRRVIGCAPAIIIAAVSAAKRRWTTF